MMMNLSKWLPARDFSRIKWLRFWRSVFNNANDRRRQEILEETKDLSWVYLGDGTPNIKKILSGITVDNYTFPINYDQDLMRKTIQGNHRHTNKVQIWIGTKSVMGESLLPQHNGFHKIIYDPATGNHNLSKHDDRAFVKWNLGFTDSVSLPPMSINYK